VLLLLLVVVVVWLVRAPCCLRLRAAACVCHWCLWQRHSRRKQHRLGSDVIQRHLLRHAVELQHPHLGPDSQQLLAALLLLLLLWHQLQESR
jgi:hypothetical protein